MVRLNKIYTRSGDGGDTALGDGTRVTKTAARIEAYGTVDELNAFVGACVHLVPDGDERDRLLRIENDLFDVGADLCTPWSPDETEKKLRIGGGSVARIERLIDAVNDDLPPLDSFILPGGNELAGAYHLARVVCRRAERRVLAVMEAEPERVNPLTAVYLNRLSDLFFVLAREAAGEDAPLWKPGGGTDA